MADRSSLPRAPHPLWQMTTAELTKYEGELEQTLETDLEPALYTTVMSRLGDVAEQWASRQRVRNLRRWPIF